MIGFHGYTLAAVPEIATAKTFDTGVTIRYRFGEEVVYSSFLGANTRPGEPHQLTRFALSDAVAASMPELRDALLHRGADGKWRIRPWNWFQYSHPIHQPYGYPLFANRYVVLAQLPPVDCWFEVMNGDVVMAQAPFVRDFFDLGDPLALYGERGIPTYDVPAKVMDAHPRELLRHLEYAK